MTDTDFYRSAHDAVVRYVRQVVHLPSFPYGAHDIPIVTETVDNQGIPTIDDPVLRVVATNGINGQVLPQSDDVWLAIRPFHDITKTKSPVDTTEWLERRMALIALLVRLSASPRFGWSPMMYCGGEQCFEHSLRPQDMFWFELLRDLNPDTQHDGQMIMERNLVALRQSPSPRFLLSIDTYRGDIDLASPSGSISVGYKHQD